MAEDHNYTTSGKNEKIDLQEMIKDQQETLDNLNQKVANQNAVLLRLTKTLRYQKVVITVIALGLASLVVYVLIPPSEPKIDNPWVGYWLSIEDGSDGSMFLRAIGRKKMKVILITTKDSGVF